MTQIDWPVVLMFFIPIGILALLCIAYACGYYKGRLDEIKKSHEQKS